MEILELERKLVVEEVFKEAKRIKEWIYCPPSRPCVVKPRALPHGKVNWLIKEGKEVNISV
jgi:hypothetical protein